MNDDFESRDTRLDEIGIDEGKDKVRRKNCRNTDAEIPDSQDQKISSSGQGLVRMAGGSNRYSRRNDFPGPFGSDRWEVEGYWKLDRIFKVS